MTDGSSNETGASSPSEPSPQPSAQWPRRPVVEGLVIFAISAVLTRVLSDLAGLSSFFAEFLFTLVAAVFLLVPYLWLTQKKRDFEPYGLTWTGWPRAIGLGLLLATVTAVPFFIGYHYWRTEVLDHNFEFRWDNYQRLPLEMDGAPPTTANPDRPAVHVWKDGARVFLQWSAGPGDHRLDIRLHSPGGEILMESGRIWAHDPAVRSRGAAVDTVRLVSHTVEPTLRHARFRLRGGDSLAVAVRLDRTLVTRDILRGGRIPIKTGGRRAVR